VYDILFSEEDKKRHFKKCRNGFVICFCPYNGSQTVIVMPIILNTA